MKDSGERGFVQAYNAQIAVDSQAQIIVAAELTQQPIDRQQLLPMVKSLRSTVQGCQQPSPPMRAIGTQPAFWIRR